MPKGSLKKKAVNYIVTSNTSFPSARALRDAIERISGQHFYVTAKPGIAHNAIARYGGNITVPNLDSGLNSIERIAVLGSKSAFARAIGITGAPYVVPQFHTSGMPEQYPVLIRETLTGFGGRGIHLIRDEAEFRATWRAGWWWVQYYSFKSEYRVHVAGGEILRVFEKVREDGAPAEDYPIRNADRGYHFSLIERPLFGASIRAAVEFIRQIPMFSQGFFALDVGGISGSTKENRPSQLVILEGNSAPGLTENEHTANLYAQYICSTLGIQYAMPGEVTAQPIPATAAAVAVMTTPVQPVVRPPVEQARPVVERRPDAVLRTETNTEGVRLPDTGNSGRVEHRNPPRSTEWTW